MYKVLLAAIAVFVFAGCSQNKIVVECPKCVIESVDGNVSYSCDGCTINAEVHEDMSLIDIGRN